MIGPAKRNPGWTAVAFQRERTSKLRRVTEGQSLGSTWWTKLGALMTGVWERMDEAAHGYERVSLANRNDQTDAPDFWKAPTGQVMIVAIILVLFMSMVLHLL